MTAPKEYVGADAERVTRIIREQAAEIERLRSAMKRAADMLPANAACGVLRAALGHQQSGRKE